jgi:predicted nucleotidyltransferase
MDYSPDTIRTMIDKAVRRTDENATPSFAVVSGSHIYGFPSESGGDVDVRGFHLVDADRYLRLDDPQEQYIINQNGITDEFEDYADIDLVSYELKKFTSLVYSCNFNVLEVIFCGEEIINGVPLEMRRVKQIISEELPSNVPQTYVGMAKSNYYKFLNPNKDTYHPTAKKFLYVLRGLIAAQYVIDEKAITADVRELAEWHGEYTEIIDDLIDTKRDNETVTVTDDLAKWADESIATLFGEVNPARDVDKTAYKEKLNEWMLKVRDSRSNLD